MGKELTIVTIHYSFDTDVVALVFDSYKKACAYIKRDYKKEKKNDIQDGWTINEEMTYCKENIAVLTTNYRNGIGTTIWTVAKVIDKR